MVRPRTVVELSELRKLSGKVVKVHEELGLVLGYAAVCKDAGQDYFDLQDDNFDEAAMVKAALDFAQNSQIAKEMHDGDATGSVPLVFPMTTEIAKAFGIEIEKSGLMIAMKPDDDMMAKFKSGELTGFSVGGIVEEFEELADAA